MQLEASYVSTLEECVYSIVDSRSPSEIFKILLEGSHCAAPRGAVFLVRQSHIKGWGSIGYDDDVAAAQRAFRSDVGHGWIGELIADPAGAIRIRRAGGDPDFGQAAPSDTAAMTVRVKGRTIAVVMVERSAGESPWLPEALSLLVAVAQLRLELDLALRKVKTGAPAAVGPVDTAVPVETAAPRDVDTPDPVDPRLPTPSISAESIETVLIEAEPEPEPPAPMEVTALEEAPEPLEVHPEIVAAQRFARLVATEIRLYNEDAVVQGRRDKDLVGRLGDQLGRGKETFLNRHGELGSAALEILHEAFVEVLAGGDPELLPASALGGP